MPIWRVPELSESLLLLPDEEELGACALIGSVSPEAALALVTSIFHLVATHTIP